jgi:hypothetical protein
MGELYSINIEDQLERVCGDNGHRITGQAGFHRMLLAPTIIFSSSSF